MLFQMFCKPIGRNQLVTHGLRLDEMPFIIIINPLTARVVGAPQMILQPDFSIFPCSSLPSGTCRTPFPDVVFPPLPLSALSPFTVPCKMVSARPDERET